MSFHIYGAQYPAPFYPQMGIIEDELKEVRACCETQIPGSKLVAAVEQLVRVEIRRTEFKTIACCFMFPAQYPDKPILLELKSKTISQKLLAGLTRVAENECKKLFQLLGFDAACVPGAMAAMKKDSQGGQLSKRTHR